MPPRKKSSRKGMYIRPDPYLVSTFSATMAQREETQKEREQKPFKCCACGRRFVKQKGNFYHNHSVFFEGNNGFLPICCKCLESFLAQYTEKLHSQDEALKRIAMHWDFYVSDSLLGAKKVSSTHTRLSEYVSHCNLVGNLGKTYDIYLDETIDRGIQSEEQLEHMRENGDIDTTDASIKRWGLGFSATDYKTLDEHYKMLKKYNPNCENNQEIFIKDLCTTKLQQQKALQKNDFDTYDKASKSYRETFKVAGLRMIEDTDNSAEETLGVTLATISQYTPEEYYKDKKLYKDFDGIGEYIERFMLRPLRNIQFGTKDRDKHYHIKGDVDGEV